MTAQVAEVRAPARMLSSERLGVGILSAVAGYVDTSGYLVLYGLFTAHVTGNLVTAGAAIARRAPEGVFAKLIMLPAFMGCVAATAALTRSLRRRGKAPLVTLLVLLTAALGTFWASGVALEHRVDGPDAPALALIGVFGVVALGVQNGLMREVLGTMSPTTVMTGNLTQFTIDAVEAAFPIGADAAELARDRAEATRRMIKSGLPLAGFVCGAALGAYATGQYGLWSLGAPTIAVAILTGMATSARRREEIRDGSPRQRPLRRSGGPAPRSAPS